MSPEELREVFDQIDKVVPTQTGKLAGSILAAFSFAAFLWRKSLGCITGRISRHLNLGSTETYKKVLHE